MPKTSDAKDREDHGGPVFQGNYDGEVFSSSCLVPVWSKPWWLEVEESKELSIPVSTRCLLLGLNGSGTLAVLAGVANMFSHVLMSTNFLNGKLTLNEIVDYHWFEWTFARYLYGWIWTQLLYITVQWKCTCMLAKDYMQLTFITCWRSREYGLQVHSPEYLPCVLGDVFILTCHFLFQPYSGGSFINF